MSVPVNSNQYCIVVIRYVNKALTQQYYPIQQLIPWTKTQKNKKKNLFALVIKEKGRNYRELYWNSS